MGIKFSPGCPCCNPCFHCRDQMPSKWQVTFKNFISSQPGPFGCTPQDCGNLNATFLATFLVASNLQSGGCQWGLHPIPFPVCGQTVNLTVSLEPELGGPGGVVLLKVLLSDPAINWVTYLNRYNSDPFDCMGVDDDVTWFQSNNQRCVASQLVGSCHVKAIA